MSFSAVSNELVYRGRHEENDELMDVPIRRFNSLGALELDLEQSARYLVTDPGFSLPLDFLFIPRGRDRLFVGFHGAETYVPDKFPKFQFVRSFKGREGSILSLFDTTLLQHEKLNIGWMAGNQETPLAALYSTVVRLAGLALGVQETILVGHSAGGFAAMQVGARVPNSRTISINGQVVVSKHRPWLVKKLWKHAFPEVPTREEFVKRYRCRLDLREILDHRVETSTFTYFGHRDDRLTMTDHPHLPLLADYFGMNSHEGGRTAEGDAIVICDWKSSNPNPHAIPGSVQPFVALTLGETPSRPIGHTCDPGW